MQQLGLVFNIASQGLNSVYDCNAKGQTWTKHVPDLRGDFSALPNLDGSGQIVYQLRFLGAEGTLIGLVRPQKGNMSRGADHSVAWVHVPARLKISGAELVEVLQGVETAISRKESTDTALFDRLFAKTYEQNPLARPAISRLTSKADGRIGVRNYSATGGAIPTLAELFDALAQPIYGECKAVFLVDVSVGLQTSAEVQIISQPLQHLVVVNPPKARDSYAPYLKSEERSGTPFNAAQEFVEGETLELYWMRKGYKPIVKKAVVQPNLNADEAFAFTTQEVKRQLLPSFFIVRSEKGTAIANAEIRIDNQTLTEKGLYFTDAEWKNAHSILVLAKGYDNKTLKDALPSQQGMRIILKEKVCCVQSKLQLKDGDQYIGDVMIEIRTKCPISLSDLVLKNGELSLKSSARKDKSSGKDGKGKKSSMAPWMKWAGIAAAALIIVGGLGFVAYTFLTEDAEDKVENTNAPSEVTDPETQNDPTMSEDEDKDVLAVVNYLDTNSKWSKDSLEEKSKGVGLFDAINSFNFSDIRISYSVVVRKSEKLKEILGLGEKLESVGARITDSYSSDGTITVEKYLKQLQAKVNKAEGGAPAPQGTPASSQNPSQKNPEQKKERQEKKNSSADTHKGKTEDKPKADKNQQQPGAEHSKPGKDATAGEKKAEQEKQAEIKNPKGNYSPAGSSRKGKK